MFLLLIFNLICLLPKIVYVSAEYEIKSISPPGGLLLDAPKWSPSEKVLYYVDSLAQTIFRYDPAKEELTSRQVGYGFVGLAAPIKDNPGTIVVAIRNALYFLKWGAPGGDSAFKMFTAVDIGKTNNIISDGKSDANGNFWFGSLGKPIKIYPNPIIVPDKGSLYMVNRHNIQNPEVKLRPVTLPNGITWSLDDKKFYFNDSPKRKVQAFDYDMENVEIANKTIFFNLDDYNLPGVADGLETDIDGNIWLATFQGASILKIDGKTGKLLENINLPIDAVTSMAWGDEDLSTLYVTTAAAEVESPKKYSGSLLAIKNLGTKGKPPYQFVFQNIEKYVST